jgi:hypothetical protein
MSGRTRRDASGARWCASVTALAVSGALVLAPTAASAADRDDDGSAAGVTVSVVIAPLSTCPAVGERPRNKPLKGGNCSEDKPPRGPKGGRPKGGSPEQKRGAPACTSGASRLSEADPCPTSARIDVSANFK